jgi:carboxyl-terminal processing protease
MTAMTRTPTVPLLAPLLALLLAACSQPSQGAPVPAPPPSAGQPAGAAAPVRAAEAPAPAPPERFSDAARSFDAVRKALLEGYYRDSVTEEDLYRAAVAGMLERADPAMHEWNKLLSPSEIHELRNDLKGELVGVGVKIELDPATGYIDVRGTVPGSPAERAGVAPPDKIVTIDGRLYRGLTLRDVVADIRGKPGETVTLSILRGDRLVSVPLARERIAYDQVRGMVVGGVGYLRVPSFNAKTPAAAHDALADLASRHVSALVVDLRGCPGGSFDDAVATASELVPPGATIVSLQKRGKTEAIASKGAPIAPELPVAVLVDHGTSSGAEVVAAALRDDRKAVLVGQRTFGKWTVQTIEDLPNGYAFKYTHALMLSPAGASAQGLGLAPDVEVDMAADEVDRQQAVTDPVARLAGDVQLRTAVTLLGHR